MSDVVAIALVCLLLLSALVSIVCVLIKPPLARLSKKPEIPEHTAKSVSATTEVRAMPRISRRVMAADD